MRTVQYDHLEVETADGHRELHRWTPRDAAPRRVTVLFHGYAEHIGRYHDVATQLADDGALVIGVDIHGHGLSSGTPGDILDLSAEATLLSRVVSRSITNASSGSPLPLGLLGHSLGGLVALLVVRRLREPVRALVLSSPAIGDWSGPEVLLHRGDLRGRGMSPAQLTADREAQARYVDDPLVWRGGFSLQTLNAMTRGLEEIRHLGTPTLNGTPGLWIHGRDDRLVPIEESRTGIAAIDCAWEYNLIAGARHEVLQDSSRKPHVEQICHFFRSHLNTDRFSW